MARQGGFLEKTNVVSFEKTTLAMSKKLDFQWGDTHFERGTNEIWE